MDKATSHRLLFCEKMLQRVKNTEHELKWKSFRDNLQQTLSVEQTKKVDAFILKAKLTCANPQLQSSKGASLSACIQLVTTETSNNIATPNRDAMKHKNRNEVKETQTPHVQPQSASEKRLRTRSLSVKTFDGATTPKLLIKEVRKPSIEVKEAQAVSKTPETAAVLQKLTRNRSLSVRNVERRPEVNVADKVQEPDQPLVATPQQSQSSITVQPSTLSIKSVVQEPVEQLSSQEVSVPEIEISKKAEKVCQIAVNRPPLKLKLSRIFKRHEERIKKQRTKRSKQVKADRIREQCRPTQTLLAPPMPVLKSFYLPVPVYPPQLVVKNNLSIVQATPVEIPTNFFEQYGLKECSVKLTRCDSDAATLSSENTLGQPDDMFLRPEDCLAIDVEIKEETLGKYTGIGQIHLSIKKTISRLAYLIINNELRMTCLLCSFEHHDKDEFKKHLENNHAKYRWYGNCSACGAFKYYRAASSVTELEHMLECHVEKESVKILETSSTPGIDQRNQGAAFQDKPMVSIPRDLLPPELVRNPESVVANTTKRRLQPWLDATALKEQKLEEVCAKMLSIECLSALYKCMSVNCSFYTHDKAIFDKHINLHFTFRVRGDSSFMMCSYCNYNEKFAYDLTKHIDSKHGAAKYQCSFCFYRSYGPQVEIHQFIYHFEKKPTMIKCIVSHKTDLREVVQEITKHASTNLSPILCMICQSKHYSFNMYIKHLKMQHHFVSTKCSKCSESVTMKTIISHLKRCFNYGNFQCCYCPFGTDSRQQYKVHLVKSHPIDLPLYFDRMNDPDVNNPEGLLSIKRIPFIINEQPCLVHMSPRNEEIRNEKSVEVLE